MNFRAQSSFTGLNVAVASNTYSAANRLSVEQGAAVVLAEAKSIVPVDTSELSDSGHIEIEVDGPMATGFVIFDAPHAQFVEYGTGLRGMGTYPYDLPTEGVPITGGWVYDYKKQEWIGHAAQPYARPALDTARPAIAGIFRNNFASATAILGRK